LVAKDYKTMPVLPQQNQTMTNDVVQTGFFFFFYCFVILLFFAPKVLEMNTRLKGVEDLLSKILMVFNVVFATNSDSGRKFNLVESIHKIIEQGEQISTLLRVLSQDKTIGNLVLTSSLVSLFYIALGCTTYIYLLLYSTQRYPNT